MDLPVESLDLRLILAVAIALIVAVIAAIWLLRRRRSVHRQIHRLVRSISNDALIDVNVPDGMEGEIHIDYLLLTSRGLLLFDVNDVTGAVFAGDRLDVWTAVTPNHRLTFDNPLQGLHDRAAAVAWLAPELPIETRVLFPRATFPKGHPDSVTTLEALREEFAPARAGQSAEDLDAMTPHWERLKASATR